MNNKERKKIIAQRKPKKRTNKTDLERLRENLTKYQNFVSYSTNIISKESKELENLSYKELYNEINKQLHNIQNEKNKCMISCNISKNYNENCWKKELKIISTLEQMTK